MNHKLANTMKILFFLKKLKILHQERRGEVNTIVMEHFKSILFDKSGPANKQHAFYHLIYSEGLNLGDRRAG